MNLPVTARTSARLAATACLAAAIVAAAGCRGRLLLTEQAEARRIASTLHLEFVKALEASNRAVISESDAQSDAFAKEAEQASAAVEKYLEDLQRIIQSLGYDKETKILGAFRERFVEYRKLDAEVLSLAVENTNLKAQRLSFGAAKDAADAFSSAVERITAADTQPETEALAATAKAAVLEILVIQARHIAEPDDASMTRMEGEMSASEKVVRKALGGLRARPKAPSESIKAATDALDRFMGVNAEIVKLSRRNSNVRSVSVTLGRKRVVAAECEDQLRTLAEALASHTFDATR